MRRIKTSDDILRSYVDMGANATREGIIMRVEQLPSNQLQCLEVCDVRRKADLQHHMNTHACTGFSSEIGAKLRDWAVGQAVGSFYSQAALSSNDSKTR